MGADVEQISHIARLAILAMCARGVAESEFEQDPEISALRFTVARTGDGSETPIDVEFVNALGFAVGGMAL